MEDVSNSRKFGIDVFLSYASADDSGDSGTEGWVSRFSKELQSRLLQIAGREVKMWLDRPSVATGAAFESQVRNAMDNTVLFMPILSPAYVASEYCQDQLRRFTNQADVTRVVAVIKYPVSREHAGPEPTGHRFYRKTSEFLIQELDGPRRKQAIDELAQQVVLMLRSLNVFAGPNGPKRQMQVFLCHASQDKPKIRAFGTKLRGEGFDPWLDVEKLLPGTRLAA